MVDLLTFLQQYANAFLVLFLILLGIGVLVNYLLWLLGWGRFSGAMNVPKEKKLNFVITEAAFKLINDFRHLLALILVLVFSAVLLYAVYISRGDVDALKNALQAVMATLGGLVASIIGYYFGEARSNAALGGGQGAGTNPPPPPAPAVQPPPVTGTGAAADITPAPAPPGSSTNPIVTEPPAEG